MTKGRVYHGEDGVKQMLYDDRKRSVEMFWSLYQDTADKNGNGYLEALAIICERMPFFEHPEVGQEIARRLRELAPARGSKKGLQRKYIEQHIFYLNCEMKEQEPHLTKGQRAVRINKLFPEITIRSIEELID